MQTTVAITIILAQIVLAIDQWGPSVSFGPSTSRIIYAKTTIIPGHFPPVSSTVGPLFLWPGMSNGTGDLIQTTLEAWPDNSWCGATSGQWCADASDFGSFGQLSGTATAVNYDDHITIEYALQSDQVTWVQTVSSLQLNKVISTFSHQDGPMMHTGFGFGTECDSNSYTIDNQYYINTILKFENADPNFGSTVSVGNGGFANGPYGKYSGLQTLDGGLTWTVDIITLGAMVPTGPQSGPPTITSTTTTTTTTTAVKTTTTTAATTSKTTSGSSSCSALYGQCGGIGWTGPTCCASGTCTFSNDWYSQCV
ncbi:hypothetical protein HK100_011484 [Physocladia obscura]|uniref:CBM1 domain-containing protein n=1 Tax=Physocladia obscura TaxID=109957 RepID=A0AAD5T147_9FUNG|nr:hypothetical protein HK100_011484 [Physocladia obscura]